MGVEEIQILTHFKNDSTTVRDIFKESVDVEIGHCSSSTNQLPGEASELTENLILCSASSVTLNLLETLQISCVVNVAPELPDLPLGNDVVHHKIPVIDSGSSRISSAFDEAADVMQKAANSGGRVLVYCVAGVSRSASICIAYLMKHLNLSLLEAYNYVKMKRPKIKPNCGFFKQLIEYEKELFGSNTVKMIFNDFVQMEIPDVYDSEYQFVTHLNKKRRNLSGRH